MDSLRDAFENYCPCCGRGSEYVLDYIKAHDSDPKALFSEFINLSDYVACEVINLINGSDYDIFVPWFKAVLVYYRDNVSGGIKVSAADLLDYYKDSFDKVEDMA